MSAPESPVTISMGRHQLLGHSSYVSPPQVTGPSTVPLNIFTEKPAVFEAIRLQSLHRARLHLPSF